MGKYNIQGSDIALIYQRILQISIKLEILSRTGDYIDEIKGQIISGNNSVDADSAIRRTASLSFNPDVKSRTILDSQGYFWINKMVKIYLGITNIRTGEVTWWSQGVYLFTSTSMTYDAATGQIDLSCSDMNVLMDGTSNGELGQSSIIIPAYEEILNSAWIEEAIANLPAADKYVRYKQFEYIREILGYDNNITEIGSYSWADHRYSDAAYELCMDAENIDYYTEEKKLEIVMQGLHRYDRLIYMHDSNNGVYFLNYYNTIKGNLEVILKNLGLKNYIIEDIGEPSAMPEANVNWERFRSEHPDWNYMPHTLEYSAGTNTLQIIQDIVNLYPGYEFYVDTEGVFCVNMIPNLDKDAPMITDDMFKRILISQNSSIDLSQVRNLVHLWGQQFEVDFFASEMSQTDYSSDDYSIKLPYYEDRYYNGDLIAFVCPGDNIYKCRIRIVGNKLNPDGSSEEVVLDWVDLLDESSGEVISKRDTLVRGHTYVIKIAVKYENSSNQVRAYLLGEWQPEAIAAFVNEGSKYTKRYFSDKYACPESKIFLVHPTENINSNFTIDKVGEIMKVCAGGEFDNITSDSLAEYNAKYNLWKHARLTDTVSLTTKICPFADVNIKVTYAPLLYNGLYKNYETSSTQFVSEPLDYIVKRISHDWAAGTTTWELMRFAPLYNPDQPLK